MATTGREAVLPSDLSVVRKIQDEISTALQEVVFPEEHHFAIKMAVEEALVNAIKHGNQLDPDKTVTVRYEFNHEWFEIEISDEGSGFDPEDVPDPTAPENLERPCGRGLLLMRYYMNQVVFKNSGRTLVMRKLREKKPA
ncbi:MAG: ATP-binding protein [Zavarzinella sp.]